MKRAKLLFYIPSLTGGGAERVLVNLLNNIDRTRYEIDLCLLYNKNIFENEIPGDINCFSLISNKILWNIFRFFSVILKSNTLFKHYFIRRVNTQSYKTAVCFMDGEYTYLLLLFPPFTRKISWVHSNYSTNPKYQKIIHRLGRSRMKRAYSSIDSIVFVSNDIKKNFLKEFGTYQNMPVIYNIIMNEKLRKFSSIDHIGNNLVPTGIAVGRLEPVKGFDRLIRAVSLLKKDNYQFKINILGDGPEREKLHQMILDFNLQEEVQLLGFVSNPYQYMSQSDFLILTSLAEGLPTVLCESFYLGLPIISTRCTGSCELLNNGEFGIIAEQSDNSVYESLKIFLSNDEAIQKYASLSQQRVAICDEKVIISKVQDLFE